MSNEMTDTIKALARLTEWPGLIDDGRPDDERVECHLLAGDLRVLHSLLPTLRAVLAPAADVCHCPEHGSWVSKDDQDRLVRELDVLLNGEDGAAKQASLCDIVSQVRREQLSLYRGPHPTPAPDGAEEVEDEIRGRHEAWPVDAMGGPLTPFGEACTDRATLLRLLDAERARRVEWQPMETAPRDGQYILAIVGKNDSQHMAHLEGRVFSIRPESFGTGWSVYPGYGGAPDRQFTYWKPLDLPATNKDTQDE